MECHGNTFKRPQCLTMVTGGVSEIIDIYLHPVGREEGKRILEQRVGCRCVSAWACPRRLARCLTPCEKSCHGNSARK